MLPMPLSEAISALREGRWDEYLALIQPRLSTDEEQIWLELAAEHQISVDLIAVLRTLSKEQAQVACHRLLPAIGKLSVLSLNEALSLLDFAEALEPSFRYSPAQQLRPHIGAQGSLGVEIGESLRANPSRGEAAHRAWASAFAIASPEGAVRYAVGLITGTPIDTQLLVSLLDYLPLDAPTIQLVLACHEERLAKLLQDKTSEVGPPAWSALASILAFSPTAATYMLEAIDSANLHAAVAVAGALCRLSPPAFGATAVPIQNVIRRLLDIGILQQEARLPIDNSIAGLMFQASLRPHAVACLLDLCTVNLNVVEMFGAAFRALAHHADDFIRVMSEWLLHPNSNFSSLRKLLSFCTTQQAPVGLDGTAFVAHGLERTVKAVRRLLALTHHGPTLTQFISAIVEMTEIGDTRLSLAGQMLNLSFAEYPGATEEYLKEKARSCPRRNPAATVFRSIYANVLRWRRVLDRLPKRTELRPTDAELQALGAMKRRVNREILRMAEDQSVFRMLATSAHLAQGRKFASHTQFGPPRITEMAESSHSVELPSSELADPMRGELERRNLLGSAR